MIRDRRKNINLFINYLTPTPMVDRHVLKQRLLTYRANHIHPSSNKNDIELAILMGKLDKELKYYRDKSQKKEPAAKNTPNATIGPVTINSNRANNAQSGQSKYMPLQNYKSPMHIQRK